MLTVDDVFVEVESGQDFYRAEDYDRKIIVDQRTELVAKTILRILVKWATPIDLHT